MTPPQPCVGLRRRCECSTSSPPISFHSLKSDIGSCPGCRTSASASTPARRGPNSCPLSGATSRSCSRGTRRSRNSWCGWRRRASTTPARSLLRATPFRRLACLLLGSFRRRPCWLRRPSPRRADARSGGSLEGCPWQQPWPSRRCCDSGATTATSRGSFARSKPRSRPTRRRSERSATVWRSCCTKKTSSEARCRTRYRGCAT